MTSMVHAQSFDDNRVQSHGNLHASPGASPRISRPSSQSSLHLPPHGSYSPHLPAESPHPVSAYPTQAYNRPFPETLSLPPLPNGFLGNYSSTATPVMQFYPTAPPTAPIYDSRSSQPMIRTISHAHPMGSANETVSSRYSSSPHSASAQLMDGPATASVAQSHTWANTAINPTVFGNSSYSMSRSTSGASDGPDTTRLLTPHLDYRRSPHEIDLRKVSDSLANGKYIPQVAFTPSFDPQSHSLGLGPHPQPGEMFFGNRGYGNSNFSLSEERGNDRDANLMDETEYERERAAQIMNNKKLLEDVGLGGHSIGFGSRHVSGMSTGATKNRKVSTPAKKRLHLEGRVRASPRIRSRNISYANLDGASVSDEEYEDSEELAEDEEDFKPSKRSKGHTGFRQKSASYAGRKQSGHKSQQLSLWGLLQTYPEIPHLFPLFYYTLNNDLTINSDSVPLIGSIPSNCTPAMKAETLQGFFHRGRRVLAQLDAFTARCDRKYEGPDERWPELDYHARIAIRDVRRKVVERCENYKYTRRDILDKHLGKGKWEPIEANMVEWRVGMTENDPADDLVNVTLTLPTPPPNVYIQQQMQIRQQAPPLYTDRPIKAFPKGRRIASSAAPRSVSVVMAEPDYPATSNTLAQFGYQQQAPMAPMYEEDQVPLSVQMPIDENAVSPKSEH
ncbi:uncharacterized protein L203_105049 [Cryptococcus depauperatus CBS 7841]|uniref:Uncharacterized protein n=1 Tax=Cryptococcus depauperatus CBS 7841 TaxID=1295531 RepID=A0AAJ8JWQ4_9TREE